MGLRSTIVDRISGKSAHVSDHGSLSVSAFGGSGPVAAYRTRHFRDAAGSEDAAIDGSIATGTPTEFFIRPPPGEIWRINRMLVFVEDSKINAAQYGTQAVALGVRLYLANDHGETNDLMDGGAVNTSAEWAEYCFDANAKAWGAGNEFLTVRWTFTKAGVPLRLVGDRRERLAILIQDDLSGLAAHEFIVQGYKEGEVHV